MYIIQIINYSARDNGSLCNFKEKCLYLAVQCCFLWLLLFRVPHHIIEPVTQLPDPVSHLVLPKLIAMLSRHSAFTI